ncbi:hypothetical protein Micbo1qcDRAFT_128974 [Microdochium bolleyi]|uniref:BTB domain-containing protein n=1 Tax=Microdochium bolleyi TaxID=196109 RepID=A0A136IIP7_9PEZI|nr:hypothetical protein Micbo1qcDRAFT_128974 [Microdochium bolleyi]
MDTSDNDEVAILVGEKNTRFCFKKETLCACSSFFESAFKRGFREATEQEVRLPDHNDKAFDIIARWLSDRDMSRFEDLEWSLLCAIFVLVDYLAISSLEEPLLDVLRSKRHESRKVPVSYVQFVYDNTHFGSPLRRLWVNWVVDLQAPEIFESEEWKFPIEFLRELAAAQMGDRGRIIKELKDASQTIGMRSPAALEPAEWVKSFEEPSRRLHGL